MRIKLFSLFIIFLFTSLFIVKKVDAQLAPDEVEMPDCTGPASVTSTSPSRISCDSQRSVKCDALNNGTNMACCSSYQACNDLKQYFSSYPIERYCDKTVSSACSEPNHSLCVVSLPNQQQRLCCQDTALQLCHNYATIVGGFMTAEYAYEQNQSGGTPLCQEIDQNQSCLNFPTLPVGCSELNTNKTYCCPTERSCFAEHPGSISSTTETSIPEIPEQQKNSDLFKRINPLMLSTDLNQQSTNLSTPAGIINKFLIYAFPLAGLILFVMIVWGGFKMLMQATSKKSIEDGKKIITNAVIGFMLLFVAYWVMQIIEVIFGIKVL